MNRDFPFYAIFGATEPQFCERESEVIEAAFQCLGDIRIYRIAEDVPPRDVTEDLFLDLWEIEGPQGTYPRFFIRELMSADQLDQYRQAHGEDE